MMELINKLAENSLLSLLLAISLVANFKLVKMILAEKDKRIETSEKTVNEVAQPLKNIQQTQELIYEKIKISKEASNET